MTALPKHTVTRLTGVAMAIALAACALLAVVTLLPGGQPQPALAAGIGVGSITHTLVSDFNVCTVLTGTVNRVLTNTIVSNADGGEIRLVAFLEDYFDGTSVDGTKWFTGVLNMGYNRPPVVSSGLITFDNSFVSSTLTVPDPGRVFEARARLQQPSGTTGFGDIGFGRQAAPGGGDANSANRLFLTNGANQLRANARDGSILPTETVMSGFDLTQFHRYRIEWSATQTRYYIDGAIYPTATVNSSFVYSPHVWLYTLNTGVLLDVDWVRVNYYLTTTGQYAACAMDSGQQSNWLALTWTADLPTGTSVAFETRSSSDGSTWSGWSPVAASGSTIASPNGRYLQYRAALTTTDVNASPEIGNVIVGYELNESPIANAGGPYTTTEGTPLVLSGALSSDPNGDPISYAWDLDNDGGFTDASGVTATVAFPNGPGSQIIGLRVSDESGVTGTQTTTVAINNVAPTASTTGPYGGNEGSPIAFTGNFSDPGTLDTHTFLWNFGDGSTSTSQSPSYAYADNGLYTAVFTATDNNGGFGVATTTVTVNNVAPAASTTGPYGGNEGSPIAFTGNFTDPGSADTHAFLWNFGDGVTSTLRTPSHIYADNGVYTAVFTATDDDGGFGVASTSVTVANVAPTAAFAATSPVDQGNNSNLSLTSPVDPGSADTSAGFRYSFACPGDSLATTYAGAGTSTSANCALVIAGLNTVRGRIFDKDDGFTTYTTTVTVNNVAPTASTTGPYSGNEGSLIAFTGIFTDPGALDTHTFLWNFGDSVTSTLRTPSHAYADNGLYTAVFTVTDNNGGFGVATTTVTVNNVAPTASTTGPYSGNEGSPIAFTGNFSDPGSADTHTFLWNFGDGSTSTLRTPSRTYADNGLYTVVFTVTDDDGGFGVASTSVTVANVAPTAAFAATSPVNEGGSSNLSLTSPFDPSSTDTSAGFRYSFACPGDSLATSYAGAGTSTSANCGFSDEGLNTVRGRIFDKDNGFTTYTTTVTVNNVAPIASTTGPYNGNEGSSIAFTGNFTDPGTLDTHSFLWNFGDGITSTNRTPSHAYADNGLFTAVFTATDNSGGIGVATTTVTVNNVAPTASTTGPYSGNEGSPIAFTGNFSDPGSADTHAFLWNFGDGVTSTLRTPSHTYADSGGYTAVFTATDDDGGFGIAAINATVANVAPIASFSASSPINEGGMSILALSSPSDPSSADTSAGFRYSFACPGDSLATSYAGAGASTSAGCAISDNGVFTVRGRIFDKDDGFTTYTTTVTVNNVAPTASTTGPYSGNEGSPIAFTGNFTDPGSGDTHTFLWNFGDGSTSTSQSPSYAYADNGVYTAVFTATDDDGGFGVATTTVTINNVAPAASTTGPYSGGEGSPIAFTGIFTDPGSADTHTFLWDFGDGVTSTLRTPSHTYADDGLYTAAFTATDDDGGLGIISTSVTVSNVAPGVSTTGPYTGAVGSPIAFTGNFTDPGPADTHTFLWDFGDGITSTLQSPSHVYTATGVYTATFTATDDDGGSNFVSTTVNVKYIVYLPLISRNVSGAGQASMAGQFAWRDGAAALAAEPCTQRDRSLCQWE